MDATYGQAAWKREYTVRNITGYALARRCISGHERVCGAQHVQGSTLDSISRGMLSNRVSTLSDCISNAEITVFGANVDTTTLVRPGETVRTYTSPMAARLRVAYRTAYGCTSSPRTEISHVTSWPSTVPSTMVPVLSWALAPFGTDPAGAQATAVIRHGGCTLLQQTMIEAFRILTAGN